MDRPKMWLAVLCAVGLSILCASAAWADALVLPAMLREIEPEAFAGDAALTDVVLPDGLRVIGERAFAGSGLRTVTMTGALPEIAANAFDDCGADLLFRVLQGSEAEGWCRRAGVDYSPLDTADDPCCLLAARTLRLPTEGGDAALNLHDAGCELASVSGGEGWLSCRIENGQLMAAAQPQVLGANREAIVTVICEHGKTRAYQIEQRGSDKRGLHVIYGDEIISEDAVLCRINTSVARTIDLELDCIGITGLTAMLMNSQVKPVIAAGMPYAGAPVDRLTFTLPQGLEVGLYRLTLLAEDDAGVTHTIALSISVGTGPTPYSGMSSAYKGSVFYQRLMDVVLSGDKANDMLMIAKSQLGYHEGNYAGTNQTSENNCTEYCRWLGYSSTPWCSSFVSWCAVLANVRSITPCINVAPGILFSSAQSGHVYSFMSYAEVKAGCKSTVEFMRDPARCTYVERDSFVPRRGDLIVINSGQYTLSHIGMVDYVSGGVVYFVDGNAEEMHRVKNSQRELTDTQITMYMRPNFGL